MKDTIAELKQDIIDASKILYLMGIRELFEGHVSARIPENSAFLVVGHLHEYGRGTLEDLKPEDIVTVNMNGQKIEGALPLLDEVTIHTSIYNARPDVNSVIHVHAPSAITLSIAGMEIKPIGVRARAFSDGVPILEEGPCIIDNDSIAGKMVKRLGGRRAIVHRGHGIVVVGKDVGDACATTVNLELTAKYQLMAAQAGRVRPFLRRDILSHKRSSMDAHPINESWVYLRGRLRAFEKGDIKSIW